MAGPQALRAAQVLLKCEGACMLRPRLRLTAAAVKHYMHACFFFNGRRQRTACNDAGANYAYVRHEDLILRGPEGCPMIGATDLAPASNAADLAPEWRNQEQAVTLASSGDEATISDAVAAVLQECADNLAEKLQHVWEEGTSPDRSMVGRRCRSSGLDFANGKFDRARKHHEENEKCDTALQQNEVLDGVALHGLLAAGLDCPYAGRRIRAFQGSLPGKVLGLGYRLAHAALVPCQQILVAEGMPLAWGSRMPKQPCSTVPEAANRVEHASCRWNTAPKEALFAESLNHAWDNTTTQMDCATSPYTAQNSNLPVQTKASVCASVATGALMFVQPLPQLLAKISDNAVCNAAEAALLACVEFLHLHLRQCISPASRESETAAGGDSCSKAFENTRDDASLELNTRLCEDDCWNPCKKMGIKVCKTAISSSGEGTDGTLAILGEKEACLRHRRASRDAINGERPTTRERGGNDSSRIASEEAGKSSTSPAGAHVAWTAAMSQREETQEGMKATICCEDRLDGEHDSDPKSLPCTRLKADSLGENSIPSTMESVDMDCAPCQNLGRVDSIAGCEVMKGVARQCAHVLAEALGAFTEVACSSRGQRCLKGLQFMSSKGAERSAHHPVRQHNSLLPLRSQEIELQTWSFTPHQKRRRTDSTFSTELQVHELAAGTFVSVTDGGQCPGSKLATGMQARKLPAEMFQCTGSKLATGMQARKLPAEMFQCTGSKLATGMQARKKRSLGKILNADARQRTSNKCSTSLHASKPSAQCASLAQEQRRASSLQEQEELQTRRVLAAGLTVCEALVAACCGPEVLPALQEVAQVLPVCSAFADAVSAGRFGENDLSQHTHGETASQHDSVAEVKSSKTVDKSDIHSLHDGPHANPHDGSCQDRSGGGLPRQYGSAGACHGKEDASACACAIRAPDVAKSVDVDVDEGSQYITLREDHRNYSPINSTVPVDTGQNRRRESKLCSEVQDVFDGRLVDLVAVLGQQLLLMRGTWARMACKAVVFDQPHSGRRCGWLPGTDGQHVSEGGDVLWSGQVDEQNTVAKFESESAKLPQQGDSLVCSRMSEAKAPCLLAEQDLPREMPASLITVAIGGDTKEEAFNAWLAHAIHNEQVAALPSHNLDEEASLAVHMRKVCEIDGVLAAAATCGSLGMLTWHCESCARACWSPVLRALRACMQSGTLQGSHDKSEAKRVLHELVYSWQEHGGEEGDSNRRDVAEYEEIASRIMTA
jgi:hypothetical protein